MSYASTILADNPLRYWRMDHYLSGPPKHIPDSSTSNSYLTAQGGDAGFVTGAVVSDSDQGALFSANGWFSGTPFSFTTPKTFSFEYWIKMSPPGPPQVIWYRSGSGWTFVISFSSAYPTLTITDSTVGGGSPNVAQSSTALTNDGNWHQVVITGNGTDVKFYIDGALINTVAGYFTPMASLSGGTNFYIGSGNGASNFMSVPFDEFSVFDYELSSAKVLKHYQAAMDTLPPVTLANYEEEDSVMLIQQGEPDQEITFRLRDEDGVPVEGVTLGDIEVKIWKQGTGTYGNTENETAHREIGDGYYTYLADVADVDTVGPSVLRASQGTNIAFQQFTVVGFPARPTTPPNPTE